MTSILRQGARTRLQFAAMCGYLCIAHNAHAGDWAFVPHLGLTEEYTDNVTLVGQDTLQDYISTINSGLSVRGISARLTSNIDYNLQKQIYDAEDSFSGLNHQLQADNALTVVDQWLYFETNSRISQQSIDNSNTFGRENRNQAGNQTTVIFYEMKPSIRHRFGSWADFDGSWSRGETSTSGGNINTRGSGGDEAIDLRLSSGRRVSRTPVSISYRRNDENFDSGSNNDQERLNAELSYVVNRKFQLDFEVGREKNSSSNDQSNQGNQLTWSVGATFTPTPRTQIDGNFGERSFGNSKNFSLKHRMRRWVFDVNYREDVRTRNQELRDLVLVPITDPFGNPVVDPTANSNILNPDDLASINENSFLTESLAANVTYRGRKTNFSAGFYDTDRTSSGDTVASTVRGMRSSISRSLSRRLSIAFSVFWRESETGSDFNNGTFLLNPSVHYTLGPHTDLSLSYSYRDGNGPDIDDNYIENSLSASVNLHY